MGYWILGTDNIQAADSIVDVGGVELIVAALRDHRSDYDVQMFACAELWAIANVATASRPAVLITELAHREVLNALRLSADSTQVQSYGCAALSSMLRLN